MQHQKKNQYFNLTKIITQNNKNIQTANKKKNFKEFYKQINKLKKKNTNFKTRKNTTYIRTSKKTLKNKQKATKKKKDQKY